MTFKQLLWAILGLIWIIVLMVLIAKVRYVLTYGSL